MVHNSVPRSGIGTNQRLRRNGKGIKLHHAYHYEQDKTANGQTLFTLRTWSVAVVCDAGGSSVGGSMVHGSTPAT